MASQNESVQRVAGVARGRRIGTKPTASKLMRGITSSILLAATLPFGAASAAVVFTQTITNPLATVSTLDDFTNCRDNEGCLGRAGQVFNSVGAPIAGGNLPNTISFTFSLSGAELTAIAANPGQTATVSMTAARDLGLRAGAAENRDYLITSVDGTGIGNLFGDTVSTCPAGENFGPINFICGPNYHNDVTASSSLVIPSSLFLTAIGDSTVNVVVDPTDFTPPDGVGRLKIFSVTLQYGAVPEPSSLLLLGIALGGLAVVRRRNSPV